MSGLGPLVIRAVHAIPLRCPLPKGKSHTSDFGLQDHFDTVLVAVETEQGITGYGEAKAAVGSAADVSALCAAIERGVGPGLLGRDARDVSALWEQMYSGSRAGHAFRTGRPMPVVDRRGTRVSAISGIDIALWDAYGKYLDVPVYRLLGGRCRTEVPVYASGGWAGPEGIGDEFSRYQEFGGFKAFKMRVGVMDGNVRRAVQRVVSARRAMGEDVELYADTHGTMSVPEAKSFCAQAEEARLGFLEEPTAIDDLTALAEVRHSTTIPIAAGESEVTRFGFRDLILIGGADILQPDPAICGGLTETMRITALAGAHLRIVVPHMWGSAVLFAAGLQLAAANTNVTLLEYPMAANPAFHELVETPAHPVDGMVSIPEGPGLGVEVNTDFIERHRMR